MASINVALALGKDLILTPGVYNLAHPIVVSRPGTVVHGPGVRDADPTARQCGLVVPPTSGSRLSGLILDAGPDNSPVLLSVGVPGFGGGTAADPDTIQDVFFRIGGAETRPCVGERQPARQRR